MIRDKLGNSTEKITKSVLTKFASHYANMACPLFTYQPKVDVKVKKLRKLRGEATIDSWYSGSGNWSADTE